MKFLSMATKYKKFRLMWKKIKKHKQNKRPKVMILLIIQKKRKKKIMTNFQSIFKMIRVKQRTEIKKRILKKT